MAITLAVSSPKLSDERVQALTGDLCRTIANETDVEAKLAEGVDQIGAKGEPISLGIIVLTFLSGGSAVALLDVMKSYLSRDSTLKLTLERNDGAKLILNAKNMRKELIDETFNTFKDFLRES